MSRPNSRSTAPRLLCACAYLVQAAMPVGINTLVVAHAYDLDLPLAASALAWTTTIAIAAGLVASAL
ncbi:MAG: hypothetical protein M3401_15680 [Actinomycetota bacterium]|nr:hypothetical protein [Actinomycetota bacterium]